MNIRGLKILLFLITAVLSLRAQEVKVEAKLDTNNILIGDQVNLNIKLTKPAGLKVLWPLSEDTISKNIEIVSKGPIDTLARDNKMITLERKYLITSFDSGYWVIRPQRFVYNILNDSTFDYVETEPLLLGVRSLPVDTTKAIKPIKGIMAEPYTFGEIMLRFVLPAVAVAALLLFVVYVIRRRKANKPIFGLAEKPLPPPHIEALDALNRLKDKKLWQRNEVKEFYSQLTDIMRRYIERRFDFPAQEMVTAEILGSLKTGEIPEDLLIKTDEILSMADLVKFAKFTPLADENDGAMRWAFDFVEKTYKKAETGEAGENGKDRDEEKREKAENGKEVEL